MQYGEDGVERRKWVSPRYYTVHHRVLLRIIGAQRKRSDHRMTSYNRALEITGCESIETTNEKTFVGGDAPPNERRAAAEANRFRKP